MKTFIRNVSAIGLTMFLLGSQTATSVQSQQPIKPESYSSGWKQICDAVQSPDMYYQVHADRLTIHACEYQSRLNVPTDHSDKAGSDTAMK